MYTANDKAVLCIARLVSLLIFAIVSFLSAEATRRVLQNHRHAVGLCGPAREEGDDRYKVARFLATSTKLSFFAVFVQISGAVFLGVSLLAGWRAGTAWSDAVFLVPKGNVVFIHQLPTPGDSTFLGNMKVHMPAICIFSVIARVFTANSSQPSVEVIVTLYSSGVKINIHVELAYSQSISNSTDSASGTYPSGNGTRAIENHAEATPDSCDKGRLSQLYWIPSGHWALQSLSLIDLSGFLAGSSKHRQPTLLSVVVIATVAMAVSVVGLPSICDLRRCNNLRGLAASYVN
ncbi:hypothetical protein OPT61_g4810 [Boeremia exigua]|uniref:Uncharacterized protein n=1 Tax=Boeremia exigua TaxID=749465 RepID=A0ACC2ICX4_9PLEO|nr:hypothetical protein OPT61_g4810 [Boeremia exigua]